MLTDAVESFRPSKYERVYWGFGIKFWFPVVKLIDYRERWDELEKIKNPFAVIVMACLKELETRGKVDERLFWKITLVKRLYEKGYSKEDILLLYKFIDWLVSLPEELTEEFHEEIKRYEEEKKMPYITTAERIGMKKGIEIGIQQGLIMEAQEMVMELLEEKFGRVKKSVIEKIKGIQSRELLKILFKIGLRVNSFEEFERKLEEVLE